MMNLSGRMAAAGEGEGLTYEAFHEAYVVPYFDVHNTFGVGAEKECKRWRRRIGELVDEHFDLNDDARVSWAEWRRWCAWALREHGKEIDDVDEMTGVILRHTVLAGFLKSS